MPSPIELRQIAYRAAADYLDSVDSNVIERQMLARGAEHIVEAVLPYLCAEPVEPTERDALDAIADWLRKVGRRAS